jgi:hypothetical protein
MPFFIFAALAGIFGFCIHKKWYGGAAVAGSIMIWMMLMQVIIAYSMHPIAN